MNLEDFAYELNMVVVMIKMDCTYDKHNTVGGLTGSA